MRLRFAMHGMMGFTRIGVLSGIVGDIHGSLTIGQPWANTDHCLVACNAPKYAGRDKICAAMTELGHKDKIPVATGLLELCF